MSLFNTEITFSEVNMSDSVKILSVTVKDPINENTKLFKLERGIHIVDLVSQDRSVIVDSVIPFIKKNIVKNSPVSFIFNNVENLYIHAFLKVNMDKVNKFERAVKKAKNINGLKNFSIISDFMSEHEAFSKLSFKCGRVEITQEMNELFNSVYFEKNVISNNKKIECVFLNQTLLSKEILSVLHYKTNEGNKIYVSRENKNKNFLGHTLERMQNGMHKEVVFMINKDISHFYNENVWENILESVKSNSSGFVILLSENKIKEELKSIDSFNQLSSLESEIEYLRGGEILFNAAKESVKEESAKLLQIASFNKKYDSVNGKDRKIQAQFDMKNGIFYGKGTYVLNGNILRSVMYCSADFKKLYEKMRQDLSSQKVNNEDIGCIFYLDVKIERKMKKNAIETENYSNILFLNEMNVESNLSFNLDNGDESSFTSLDRKSINASKNENKKEVPKTAEKAIKKSKKKSKIEETEAQKLLKSFNNKKSKHVFTCVYVKENEEKDCFLFHIISTNFSKTGNRTFEYKGVNVVPKFKLFDSCGLFMSKIKGCMKHVRSSYSQEVSFVLNFKEDYRKDFETLFAVLNEEQYAKNGPLFSVKDVNSLSNEVSYCLHNGMKMAHDDDKNKLQASNEHKKDVLYIYSDASFNKFENSKKFGYGIMLVNGDNVFKEFMGVSSSPYTVSADTSEFNSIFYALRKVRDLKNEGLIPMDMKVEVRSDCLNAIRFYDNGLDKSKLNSKESLNNIYHLDLVKAQGVIGRKEFAGLIEFKWTKGHMNEMYNEKVDSMAKKAYHSLTENEMIEIESVAEELCA